MRILLTGAGGQLGQAFREIARDHDVVPMMRIEAPGALVADLSDPASLRSAVERAAPDCVLHGAAMTNVDACERDPDAAWQQNAQATGALAEAARAVGASFVYVSTDYVFDGKQGGYREEDETRPLSVYGETKLEGERLAQAAHPDACIARTSVVFGPHKPNFVTWLVAQLRAGKEVRIVDDQRVSPTLSHDLARMTLALATRGSRGVWHTAGASAISRLEMAQAIAQAYRLDASLIHPIKSAQLEWLAPRPQDSTLDVTRIKSIHPPLRFDEALRELQEKHP